MNTKNQSKLLWILILNQRLHLALEDESPESHPERIPEVVGAIRGVCCSRWGHDEQPDKHRAVEKLEPG